MSTFKDRCRQANEMADIVAVAFHLGMDVRTQGHVPYTHCPFHGDTGRMNLAFYQEPGERGANVPRVYCFTCGTQATALDLIMKQRDCDIFEALEWLRSYLGLQDGVAQQIPVRPVIKPEKPVNNKRGAVNQAIRSLWSDLPDSKSGRDYLEYRGVLGTAEQYQLGYWAADDGRWAGRIIIPYLESLEPESAVWTMVGARIRNTLDLGQLSPDGPHTDQVGTQGNQCQPGSHDPDEVSAPGRIRDDPKYLYTSAASRKPYLWEIALARAERDGYLILTEGELDGLSVLHAFGGAAPVAALGGVGAIGAVGQEPRLAGLDLLLVADLEAPARYGTEHEEADLRKLRLIEKRVAETAWSLRRLNARVQIVYPPSINDGKKTDVNDLLMSYGPEGVLDWLLPELNTLTVKAERSLI